MKFFFNLLCSLTLISSLSAQWTFSEIGSGTKPSITIALNQDIHVASLKENISDGFLTHHAISNGTSTNTIVSAGYFYGPIDITTDAVNTPVIAFHHHNVGIDADRGELAFATQLGAEDWTIDVATSRGHDGWDGTLLFDTENKIHAIATDPSNGVEYFNNTSGDFVVATIDSTPAMYQYGTDIELDGEQLHTTFFIDQNSELKYASLNGDTWNLEVIDENSVFPSMIIKRNEPIIAYYKADRDNLGNWSSNGEIILGRRSGGQWNVSSIMNLDQVETGVFSGARTIVDIQAGNADTIHIAISNKAHIFYGIVTDDSVSIDTIYTGNTPGRTLGQQVSLAVDRSGRPHLVSYEKIDNDDGIVLYGTLGNESVQQTLICPPDITIMCDQVIDPDITGSPDPNQNFTSFTFVDSIINNCPSDLLIERYWIGLQGEESIDTCVQIINVVVDNLEDFILTDTLVIDEVCIDELDDVIQTDLDLPCNVGIDSVSINVVERNCDQIVLATEWALSDMCRDTAFDVSQTIIIENRSVGKFSDPIILPDTGSSSGGITLISSCPFDDLTYSWSTGTTDSLISMVSAGEYTVTVTDNEGCMDTLQFEVLSSINMDTMMMDSMMMDSMMMDTMMMDTMMMDSMMMDSMMMDSMMMDTMMMDTMMMDTMMMDSMMMDSMMMDSMMMDSMMMDTMMLDSMMLDSMMLDSMMMDSIMMDSMMMDSMMLDSMMMDTMMMDTMMMDSMMMDTMMMDSMMMDSMMMDTMMMDSTISEFGNSLQIEILGRDGSPLTVDSLYYMTDDSASVSFTDSIVLTNGTLVNISAVCVIKNGSPGTNLSVTDLVRGGRIILGIDNACQEDLFALDVNGDGRSSGTDLGLMRSIIVERITAYPEDLVWKFVKTNNGFTPEDTNGACVSLTDEERATGILKLMGIKLGDVTCSDSN